MKGDVARVALVTGAAGGIGMAVVRLLAESGWTVVGVDVEAGADVRADLRSATEIADLFADLGRAHGRLDALVNNAAVQVAKPFAETTVEEWDDVMTVNVRAAFLTTQHALPMLAAAGGAVVNVSSVHAVATSAGMAAYAASKGALLALTRALAVELAPRVRVNAVLPGAVDTAMLRAGFERFAEGSGARMALLAGRTVMGRVGQPDEIAHAIRFLADTRESSFVTGHALVVDGGATARLSTE
jgi:glucose 1-dehydrogenase